ncbi:MAG: CRISPR-associated helicase Cas3' [Firmicutes bacterium]|nr:CRISPR-associated helicase Cas3' [Bacillota bacterium]
MNNYELFFREATGHQPFPYQVKMATSEELPCFLGAPTGSGKTYAVILAWLWRRLKYSDQTARDVLSPDSVRRGFHEIIEPGETHGRVPRRLVYCLPMRTLVEQTYRDCKKMLENLEKAGMIPERIGTHIIMGGEIDEEWLLYPEKTQIIIGTQDMLISRALNRGYAMSRFKWPMAFGLLNNDCQWVFDEVQLMGSGLATSAQLAAFNKTMPTCRPNKYLWMSATIDRRWFETVDFSPIAASLSTFELADEDRQVESLKKRLTARKTVRKLEIAARKNSAKYYKELSLKIIASMEEGDQILVIVNRVAHAQKIFRALQNERARTRENDFDLLLVHSRFRPAERKQINKRIPEKHERRIIVATQAVEAGVNISSQTLYTELCSWPAMVQRLGRCNRFGEYDEAQVYWIDVEDRDASPYSPEEMAETRTLLEKLKGGSASPAGLPGVETGLAFRHVIRRKDFIELFDTAPDLSGSDIDVSRFVRDTEDIDVHFVWRHLDKKGEPPADLEIFHQDELCAVNIGTARAFVSRMEGNVWRWDYLDGRWRKVNSNEIRPGMTILLPAAAGGYSPDRGWHGEKGKEVEPVAIVPASIKTDDTEEDQYSFSQGGWQTLSEHTDEVVAKLEQITETLWLKPTERCMLLISARYHDAGKAHEVFQETMHRSNQDGNLPRDGMIWAKSPGNKRHRQRYFRHELAGALAFLQGGTFLAKSFPMELNLVAFLIAAHHGKVRLSVRSLPDERVPEGLPPETRITRGIWDGSTVSQADLGGGVSLPETVLDLSMIEMGRDGERGASWLERMLRLRDAFGVIKLSFLETCLRAADIRASMGGKKKKEV